MARYQESWEIVHLRVEHRLLVAAGIASLVAGCGAELGSEVEDPPRPARTRTPVQFEESIGWLGPRFGKLRFHSVDRSRRRVALVNYGDPRPPDPGSGDSWHFSLAVTTAPRGRDTRRRLQRSLGAGVPITRHAIWLPTRTRPGAHSGADRHEAARGYGQRLPRPSPRHPPAAAGLTRHPTSR